MQHACAEAAQWRNPLDIAVNISPLQFQQGDLPEQIHTILLQTGLSPSRLELEITETVLIADFDRALSMLRRLKALGLRIAMDVSAPGGLRCRRCRHFRSTMSKSIALSSTSSAGTNRRT